MEQTNDQIANQVKALQMVTIGWMAVEFLVALLSGIRAHSVSLVAFGADSAIELMSAFVVLRRFTLGARAERRAAQLGATLLLALGVYILLSVALSFFHGRPEARPSVLGIVLLLCAAMIMPILGRAKRRLANKSGSCSLRADSAQSNLCAYMSWIALCGLLLNTFLHIPWADSIAALMLLPIVLKEAAEARKGEVCGCC